METPTKVPESVRENRVMMVLEIRWSRLPAATIVLPDASATTSMGVPTTDPEASIVSAAFSRCTSPVVVTKMSPEPLAWIPVGVPPTEPVVMSPSAAAILWTVPSVVAT